MSTKTLTQEELKNVIAYADSLQQYDRRRQDQHLLEGIVRRETEKEGIALPVVYEIGEELDIPREYLQRALELLYPSKEQMKQDLFALGARPSAKAILPIYRQRLQDAFKRNVPFEEIYVENSRESEGHLYFHRVSRKKKWAFTFTQKKEIAAIWMSGSVPMYLDINLYHPLFLHAAGKELQELNGLFKEYIRQPEITYHYSAP